MVDVVSGYVDNAEPDFRAGPSGLIEGTPEILPLVRPCGKVLSTREGRRASETGADHRKLHEGLGR